MRLPRIVDNWNRLVPPILWGTGSLIRSEDHGQSIFRAEADARIIGLISTLTSRVTPRLLDVFGDQAVRGNRGLKELLGLPGHIASNPDQTQANGAQYA